MKKSDWSFWLGIGGLFVTILAVAFNMGAKLSALDELPKIKTDIAEIKTHVATIDTKIAEMEVKLDALWRIHLERALSVKLKNDPMLNSNSSSSPVALPHSPFASTNLQEAPRCR